MAAANDGLIGVVNVQMQPAAAEDLRKNVAGRSYTLTGGSSDTHTEGLPHRRLPKTGPWFQRPGTSEISSHRILRRARHRGKYRLELPSAAWIYLIARTSFSAGRDD